MRRRTAVRAALVLGAAIALPAVAAPSPSLPGSCTVGTLSAAQVLVCVPPGWNGDLVVYAHGYVAPTSGAPVIPWDQLEMPDGTSIPGIVTALGFAFAATSYSDDGLAIVQGVQDVGDLVAAFAATAPRPPDHVYLVGASEGGLVTTLAVEQSPGVFSGGLATCGPVGDFRRQIDYIGDFRVLFDYYFPRLIPGDAIDPPAVTQEQWDTEYVPAITAAFRAHPVRLDRLLRVARASFDPNEPETKIETALGVLWYNVFAARDAQAKLGGNPYDNSRRLYLGSGNDLWLNLLVDRFHADAAALAAIEEGYQTSGRLATPLVTLHTTADPVVPYWHEPLYSLRSLARSGLQHVNLPVFRYGHCSFRPEEALVALGLLVFRVEGRQLANPERVLTSEGARRRYRSLAKLNGLRR